MVREFAALFSAAYIYLGKLVVYCYVPEGKQEREEKEQGMKLGPRKMDSFGPSDVLGRRPGSGSIRSSCVGAGIEPVVTESPN